MIKKFFIISCLFSLILIGYNTNRITVNNGNVEFDSYLVNNSNNLFDKGILICKEVSNLGNFQTIKLINNWYSNMAERNNFSKVGEIFGDILYYFSFTILPIDLIMNLMKCGFNCFNILIGSQISIQPITSNGSGGGGLRGGR